MQQIIKLYKAHQNKNPWRVIIFLSVMCILFAACNNEQESNADVNANHALALMEYDRTFSAMSKENGMKAAFIEYIDSNGVLLRPNKMPLTGGAAIDYLVQQNDADYTLTWDPQHAVVAESGELGFTYGVFIIRPLRQDTALFGTYTHIWKKQLDGKWKLLLNSVNEGIDENNENLNLH